MNGEKLKGNNVCNLIVSVPMSKASAVENILPYVIYKSLTMYVKKRRFYTNKTIKNIVII